MKTHSTTLSCVMPTLSSVTDSQFPVHNARTLQDQMMLIWKLAPSRNFTKQKLISFHHICCAYLVLCNQLWQYWVKTIKVQVRTSNHSQLSWDPTVNHLFTNWLTEGEFCFNYNHLIHTGTCFDHSSFDTCTNCLWLLQKRFSYNLFW